MLIWLHFGDSHADETDGWSSVAAMESAAELGHALDFLFLPGDVANHGEPEQYRRVAAALALTVRARVFGAGGDAGVRLQVDADRPLAMAPPAGEPGVWSADVPALRPGRHALRVTAVEDGESDADQVEVDVGWREAAPVRGRPGDHSASIGAWLAHGLMGTRLGPNANGTKW